MNDLASVVWRLNVRLLSGGSSVCVHQVLIIKQVMTDAPTSLPIEHLLEAIFIVVFHTACSIERMLFLLSIVSVQLFLNAWIVGARDPHVWSMLARVKHLMGNLSYKRVFVMVSFAVDVVFVVLLAL